MANLNYEDGQRSLLALAQCARELLQTRRFLTDTLAPYASLSCSTLADVLEIISGMATELSCGSVQTITHETPITVADEPSSFDDAIEGLAKFLDEVFVVLQRPSPGDYQSMCAVAVRAQTFAFFLRENEACDANVSDTA